MKHLSTFLAAVALFFSLGAFASEKPEATPDFFDLTPGDEYPLHIPEATMRHSLPYAYLQLPLPKNSQVPLGTSYRVNVNKRTNIIAHVTIEVPVSDVSHCQYARTQLLNALSKQGFEPAKPSAPFFDRVAQKGQLVATLSCSSGAVPTSRPDIRLSPNVRLTITTLKEHEQFEAAMHQVRH